MGFTSNSPTLPFRRNRTLLVTIVTILALLLFGCSILSPEIFQAKVAVYLDTSKPKVDEIYGLIRLVTSGVEKEHTLSNALDLDPSKPVDLSVYAEGRRWLDWTGEMKRLDANYPIVVFSKSYCPYSTRAKKVLASYDIRPPPYIVEVDLRDDGSIIKTLLGRMTGHVTFPNILVRGKSIGGSDDLLALHHNQRLGEILQEAGATTRTQDV
ncbi:hypothetical protein AX15_002134 [Amanita polypyramis BW_CC]|nr:hypothetical protein AX15_002134 [Amanita polypyramis BW_CC]